MLRFVLHAFSPTAVETWNGTGDEAMAGFSNFVLGLKQLLTIGEES